MGDHQRAHRVLRQALKHGNVVVAEITAREFGRPDLTDALELTALVAVKDRPRSRRMAARWLARWLAETQTPTIDEAVMVGGCLAALGGTRHDSALKALRGEFEERRPR